MRRVIVPMVLAAPLAFGVTVLAAGCTSSSDEENPDINSCGNIHVEASAKCEVTIQGGCDVACTPIKFSAQCYADCRGGCSGSITAECRGGCEASCQGSCNPGSIDCKGGCTASCEGRCDGRCADSQCTATCKAGCESECSAKCEVDPPSCEAYCQASCDAECQVDADLDCQLECHGGCSAELQGGCMVECESPDGALFCDGQYVDHGGNLAECIAALNAYLNVDVEAHGSAACADGKCTAEAEATATCGSVAGVGSDAGLPWYAVGLAALGIIALRRRRR